jgi:hypothetical protein
MDEKDLYERGLKLRTAMFGREAVEKRMRASGSARRCRRRRSRW